MKKFKQIIKDPAFIRAAVYALICVILTYLLTLDSIGKYPKQFMYVFGLISLILFLRSVLKLLKKHRKNDRQPIFAKLSSKISPFFARLAERLGIKKSKYLYGGEDEIIYGYDPMREEKEEKRKKTRALKWKNIEDNETKIRFLYVRYTTLAQANGYTFKVSHTPRTVKSLTSKTEVSDTLFDLYEGVRYAPTHPVIKDEDVERIENSCTAVFQRKK